MRCITAIGINNDLTAGQARIAVRSANNERTGWIHVPDCVIADPAIGQAIAHGWFDHGADIIRRVVLVHVLMRHDDLGHADRLAVFINNGNLAF